MHEYYSPETGVVDDIYELLAEHLDEADCSGWYRDQLRRLAQYFFAGMAPLFSETAGTPACISLNPKDCGCMAVPVVNYVEAGEIEHALAEYVKSRFPEGYRRLAGNPWDGLFPRYLDDPEHSRVKRTKISLRSSCEKEWRAEKELLVSTKETVADAFRTQTVWNADAECRMLDFLMDYRPAPLDRHAWHYCLIDEIEWYCLTHQLTFYLVKNLYFSDDDEVVKDGGSGETYRLIDGISERLFMHAERYGLEHADSAVKTAKSIMDAAKVIPAENTSLFREVLSEAAELAGLVIGKDGDVWTRGDIEAGEDRISAIAFWSRDAALAAVAALGDAGISAFADSVEEFEEESGCDDEPADEEEAEFRAREIYMESAVRSGLSEADWNSVFPVLKAFYLQSEQGKAAYLEDEEKRGKLFSELKSVSGESAGTALFLSVMTSIGADDIDAEPDFFTVRYEFAKILYCSRDDTALHDGLETACADLLKRYPVFSSELEANRISVMLCNYALAVSRVYHGHLTLKAHRVLRTAVSGTLQFHHGCTGERALVQPVYELFCRDFETAPVLKW